MNRSQGKLIHHYQFIAEDNIKDTMCCQMKRYVKVWKGSNHRVSVLMEFMMYCPLDTGIHPPTQKLSETHNLGF
jgi:hypothetical protein